MRFGLCLSVVVLAAGLAGACATTPKAGARAFDPVTCQIRNPRPGEPIYDPDCIMAAKRAAEAAKGSGRKPPPK